MNLNTFPTSFNTVNVGQKGDSYILRASLKNLDDCKEWLSEYEDKTNVKFIYKKHLKNPERLILHRTWVCQHSARNKSTKKNTARNAKCLAYIDIKIKKISKETKRNDVYIKMNPCLNAIITINIAHTHNTDVAGSSKYLRISDETRKEFLQYFADSLSPSEAMILHDEKLRLKSTYHIDKANAAINPCKRTVYFLHDKYRKENLGAKDPLKTLESKIEFYKSKGSTISIHHDETQWSVCVATPIMKRAQKELASSENIFIDTTASVDSDGTNVTIVSTATKAGAIPLAILLHKFQTENNYEQAFQLFKDTFPEPFGGKTHPANFMTDDSTAEKNALKKVWPESNQLLCHFHMAQAEWRWLCSNESIKDRRRLVNKFRKVMYAATDKDCQDAIASIYTEEKKHPKFVKRFKKNLDRRGDWLLLDRQHLITRNHNTNNLSEASVRVLKDIVLQRNRAYNLVALVEFTVSVWNECLENRLLDFAHDRRSSPYLFYDKLCKKMVNCSKEEIEFMDDHVYLIPSSDKKRKYTINSEIGACSCKAGISGAFCKHMAFLHKELKLPLPNLPPITLDERHKLAILAIGEADCPPKNFYLRLNETMVIDGHDGLQEQDDFTPNIFELPEVENAQEVQSDEGEVEDKELREQQLAEVKAKVQGELSRILNHASVHNLYNLNALSKSMSRVQSDSQIYLFFQSIKCHLVNKNRNKRINVQSTSISRRRDGVGRGNKRVASGRPSSKETSTAKKKKRSLGLAIQNNESNAKKH